MIFLLGMIVGMVIQYYWDKYITGKINRHL